MKSAQTKTTYLLTAAYCAALAFTHVQPVNAADVTARDLARDLFKAEAGARLDYSSKDLSYLDLSGLDFKGARLSHADLYGADLTGANLKSVDFSNTRLDRSVLIRADLSGANLTGATVLRPTVFTDMTNNLADAPKFSGANLTDVRVYGHFEGADFRGANLTRANFGPYEPRPGQGTLVTRAGNVLKSCDFSGAIMKNVNLDRALLTFSRFVGADLSGADLSRTDLSMTDFSGANLTGADLTGADLYGAKLNGVSGLETAKGLSSTLNLDKTSR